MAEHQWRQKEQFMLKNLTSTRALIININNEEVKRSDKNSDDNIHDNQEG